MFMWFMFILEKTFMEKPRVFQHTLLIFLKNCCMIYTHIIAITLFLKTLTIHSLLFIGIWNINQMILRLKSTFWFVKFKKSLQNISWRFCLHFQLLLGVFYWVNVPFELNLCVNKFVDFSPLVFCLDLVFD